MILYLVNVVITVTGFFSYLLGENFFLIDTYFNEKNNAVYACMHINYDVNKIVLCIEISQLKISHYIKSHQYI